MIPECVSYMWYGHPSHLPKLPCVFFITYIPTHLCGTNGTSTVPGTIITEISQTCGIDLETEGAYWHGKTAVPTSLYWLYVCCLKVFTGRPPDVSVCKQRGPRSGPVPFTKKVKWCYEWFIHRGLIFLFAIKLYPIVVDIFVNRCHRFGDVRFPVIEWNNAVAQYVKDRHQKYVFVKWRSFIAELRYNISHKVCARVCCVLCCRGYIIYISPVPKHTKPAWYLWEFS